MPDPDNLEEHQGSTVANCKVSGFGIENVRQHICCPFCTAPGWKEYRIIDAPQEMVKNATCKVCGRSARIIITKGPGGAMLEIVQTGGTDPPAYLPPMRRV